MQPSLFDPPTGDRPDRLGKSAVSYVDTASILTRASGFMEGYDFTLNPYSGCSFGCSYCYAAFFARDPSDREAWGEWVRVKENALDRLRRRRKPLDGEAVYMSSVTDPYQPIEKKLGLVRSLLEDLAAHHRLRLVVQTRSPLVTRDLDVLTRIAERGSVRVNMTVTTDSEAVRQAFEPSCPSNRVRLRAIAEVAAAGLDAGVTMTPLLPVEDPAAFAEAVAATGARAFVVQPFHMSRGRFVAGTRDAAAAVAKRMGWTEARYRETVEALRARLPTLEEGQDGFAPPPPLAD